MRIICNGKYAGSYRFILLSDQKRLFLVKAITRNALNIKRTTDFPATLFSIITGYFPDSIFFGPIFLIVLSSRFFPISQFS